MINSRLAGSLLCVRRDVKAQRAIPLRDSKEGVLGPVGVARRREAEQTPLLYSRSSHEPLELQALPIHGPRPAGVKGADPLARSFAKREVHDDPEAAWLEFGAAMPGVVAVEQD